MRSKEIAAKLKEFENTPCYVGMLRLITELLNEARLRNDAAVEPEFYKNQGGINELKQMLKMLRSVDIVRDYDGGYGM